MKGIVTETVAVEAVDLVEVADALVADVEALVVEAEVVLEVIDLAQKCMMPPVLNVEITAKYHLDLPVTSPCFAVDVLMLIEEMEVDAAMTEEDVETTVVEEMTEDVETTE